MEASTSFDPDLFTLPASESYPEEPFNFPLQPQTEKTVPPPSAKSGISTDGSERVLTSSMKRVKKENIPENNKAVQAAGKVTQKPPKKAGLNSSFMMPTKSSVMRKNSKKVLNQQNESFRTSFHDSNSVGPWNFAAFKKNCDNSIARTSQLKAYDSYINESLADLMAGPSLSQMSITSKNRNQSIMRPRSNKKCNMSMIDRKELANKIKQTMLEREKDATPKGDCSFSAKNDPTKESFLEKGAQELKESLLALPEKEGTEKQQLTDISHISKIEPSAFIENTSLIEPLKDIDAKNTSTSNYNEGIDEYSSCMENSSSTLPGPCNTTNLCKTHNKALGESTLCSYDDVALVKNEEKINDYLTKLAKIEKKYKKMFTLLKEEKMCNMRLLVKKCLDEKELQELTSRGGSEEIVTKYKEMIEEYKRTKKLLKEQQLMENNEILAEYRQFHKGLHKC